MTRKQRSLIPLFDDSNRHRLYFAFPKEEAVTSILTLVLQILQTNATLTQLLTCVSQKTTE